MAAVLTVRQRTFDRQSGCVRCRTDPGGRWAQIARMHADPAHHVPSPPSPSDADLAYMAQAALAWVHSLPAGQVTARVEAGWLTLSGQVRWHYQRQDADHCVRNLPGLAGVSNLITLHPPGG